LTIFVSLTDTTLLRLVATAALTTAVTVASYSSLLLCYELILYIHFITIVTILNYSSSLTTASVTAIQIVTVSPLATAAAIDISITILLGFF